MTMEEPIPEEEEEEVVDDSALGPVSTPWLKLRQAVSSKHDLGFREGGVFQGTYRKRTESEDSGGKSRGARVP